MAAQESDVGKEVKAALEVDPRVDLHRFPIHVVTDGEGQLRLEGEVESIAAKRVAMIHAQRVCGMDDVERPWHEPLHPWNAGAVPQPVQHAHRHAPVVNDAGRVDCQLRVGTVFPGAREQVHPVALRRRIRQRGGQFVDVLADTGTVAQGRAVIEQNVHLPEG